MGEAGKGLFLFLFSPCIFLFRFRCCWCGFCWYVDAVFIYTTVFAAVTTTSSLWDPSSPFALLTHTFFLLFLPRSYSRALNQYNTGGDLSRAGQEWKDVRRFKIYDLRFKIYEMYKVINLKTPQIFKSIFFRQHSLPQKYTLENLTPFTQGVTTNLQILIFVDL